MPTYYLICNPFDGTVTRRSRQPAKHGDGHLFSFRVDKPTWKTYRAGDVLNFADIEDSDHQARWIRARQAYTTQ